MLYVEVPFSLILIRVSLNYDGTDGSAIHLPWMTATGKMRMFMRRSIRTLTTVKATVQAGTSQHGCHFSLKKFLKAKRVGSLSRLPQHGKG